MWLYEFTFETVRAVANLIYSGALERYPRIRFQLAHLGGAVPFLAHRIASLADRVPEAASQAPAGALEYLKRFYYDTGLADNARGAGRDPRDRPAPTGSCTAPTGPTPSRSSSRSRRRNRMRPRSSPDWRHERSGR